jgi:hypothetical protein
MEAMPDSTTISGQDATDTVAGLGAVGQEAGLRDDERVNGIMSTLGRRTSERDEAIAERDVLRQQLADMMSPPPPVTEPPGPAPNEAQLPDTDDDDDDPPEALHGAQGELEAAPAPEYSLPVGSIVKMPDGSQYLVGSAGPGILAPTNPSRSLDRPQPDSLEALRKQFNDELPGMAAQMRQNALLRGN